MPCKHCPHCQGSSRGFFSSCLTVLLLLLVVPVMIFGIIAYDDYKKTHPDTVAIPAPVNTPAPGEDEPGAVAGGNVTGKGAKTEAVRGYTTKNGTTVAPYTRSGRR